jgi:hypothetical protein
MSYRTQRVPDGPPVDALDPIDFLALSDRN